MVTHQDGACGPRVDFYLTVLCQLTDKLLNQVAKVFYEGIHTDFDSGDHAGSSLGFEAMKGAESGKKWRSSPQAAYSLQDCEESESRRERWVRIVGMSQ